MTFNATSLRLGLLNAAGLVERQSLRPTAGRRRIYVTPDIAAKLDADEPYFPRASAEALIARFRASHHITVTRRKGVEADLERLVGPDDVWVLCFRSPRPGGRLLGRFFEKDVFVGLRLKEREELGGRRYEECAREVEGEWSRLLRSSNPVRSNSVDDYISMLYKDLDVDDE